MGTCKLPHNVHGFLFDFDGTLADTVPLVSRAWEYAFKALGYDVGASDVAPLIGLPAARIVELLVGNTSSLMELSGLRMEYLMRNSGRVKLYPEVEAVLEKLRGGGYRIAVATSLPLKAVKAMVEEVGADEAFDAIVGGDEVEKGKPEPDIFLEAARRIGLEPGEAAVVGDRDYDMLPARRMGSFSILVVRDEVFCPVEKPDAIVTSLKGILELV